VVFLVRCFLSGVGRIEVGLGLVEVGWVALWVLGLEVCKRIVTSDSPWGHEVALQGEG